MDSNFIYELIFIALTIAVYILGRFIYAKSKFILFHSIIVATVLIIPVLRFVKVDIQFYQQNTKILSYLLNLSIVALGYLLYKHYDYIKSRGVTIIAATFIGSLSAILSVGLLATFFGARYETIITLLPKSVTTPIAIVISEQYGGITSLTAVIVVVSGIFGAIVGPWFLKVTGIKSKMATGLALGSAAHGIGTAKALETGALEGAAGGLAIALMGLFTSMLIPLIVPLIKILIPEI